MDKKQLRESFLYKIDELDSEYKFEADEKILDKLLSLKSYMHANTICSFVSFRSEVDTHDFIEESLVPVVDKATNTLVLCEIRSFLELKEGYMGILEPEVKEENIVGPEAIDLCIVPGAVFDDFGYRIGYGGGYYDRLLPELRSDAKTVGICYDIQRTEKLASDEYDQKVQTIVTETKVLDI